MTNHEIKKIIARFTACARAHDEVADCLKEPENVAFHHGSRIAFDEAAKVLTDAIGCVTCHGEGTVDYQTGGSNEDLIHADCPTCNGTGARS